MTDNTQAQRAKPAADIAATWGLIDQARYNIEEAIEAAEKRGRVAGLRGSPYKRTHDILVEAYTDGWSHVQLARVGRIIEEVEAEVERA